MDSYDLDIEQFWKDDALAHEENCFSKKAPQVALGIRMHDECVFAELGVPGHQWMTLPKELYLDYHKRYNDIAEKTVGIRLLSEEYPEPDAEFPSCRRIGEVFGGVYENRDYIEWLHSDIKTPEQLESRLEFAEKVDIREFALPANWESEKKRIYERYGKRPSIYKELPGQNPVTYNDLRGPCTLATTLYGIENLVFLHVDAPELFERFSKAILRVLMEYISLARDEAGYTEETLPRGFRFRDDECAIMTPEMYEVFGLPILQAVFDRVSPGEDDYRYQHSDSDMGHLLPLLARVNLTGCNFGPNISVREIRKYMPRTRIDGQLAPFAFMRNDAEEIERQIKRDCDMARENDARGVNIRTAGSINNGSKLSSMRQIMSIIQNYGRY